ncbi:hypothetical protein [Martelella limonii]|uniref:hypothetical protein n=1 Tax=Martelella limonii TaxID=1647649 RepID=UPI0015807259|nr:hypothetical protein [Martelella limonii]
MTLSPSVAVVDIDLLAQRFHVANAAWLATADENGDIEAVGPEYEAAWEACKDVLRHQCRSKEEAVRKTEIVLGHDWLIESADSNFEDERFYLRDFLKTLVPTARGRS